MILATAVQPSPRNSTASPTPPVGSTLTRQTYDAGGSESPTGGLGKLVRSEGQAAIGDAAVDAAHDNAGIVHDFLKTVLGRDSIDGAGMVMKSVVHYGQQFNNAYWDGEKMTYGDGDGKLFTPLSGALDVVGHEMTHGVTENTANLAYRGQSGALNESFSDVFGELIEQWSENRAGFGSVDAAKGAEWLIGEDVFTPGTKGDALRSMKAPGTAYKNDPQPAHMRAFVKTTKDNGGVHINSGIPNKAAYEVALKIGGEKLAKVWYMALTDYLKPNSSFVDAAGATVAAATKLYGAGAVPQAVADAWKSVGIIAGTVTAVTNRPTPIFTGQPERDGGVVPYWLLDDGKFTAGEV